MSAEVLAKYRDLHDLMSELIEAGHLQGLQDDMPATYDLLVEKMAELAILDHGPVKEYKTQTRWQNP
jgi:hypothetical protein